MKLIFAIGAYVLGILWIYYGFRDAEWVKGLCGLIWVAVGVKNTILFRMGKNPKKAEKNPVEDEKVSTEADIDTTQVDSNTANVEEGTIG